MHMRFFNYFNRVQKSVLKAFVIVSVLFVFSEISYLLSESLPDELIFSNLAKLLSGLGGYVFCYFASSYCFEFKNAEKPFLCVVFLSVFSVMYGMTPSCLVGLLAAFFYSLMMKKYNKAVSVPLCIAVSIIFGLLLRQTGDLVDNVVAVLAEFVAGKGILSSIIFALLSAISSLLGVHNFENSFFYKSYGGTIINDGNVILGIKNMVSAGYDGNLISRYLSGHFLFIFCILGVLIFLADELKGFRKISFIVTVIGAAVSGNTEIVLLFLLFESPHLLASAIILSPLSYSVAYLIDIRAGYIGNGGVIELLINMDKPVYLLMCGMVFVAIGYFVSRYSVLKYGISSNLEVYIPTRFLKLVDCLGGIMNIVRVNKCIVEVRNPKLVNNFNLNCEIRENSVKVDEDIIDDFGDYL